MGKRILVAVIFIPLLLVLIYGIAPAYPWALCLLVAGLSMISVHEVLWSTGFLKHARISGYSIVLAGLIPFWVYYDGESLPALCGLFVYVVLLFAEAIAAHKRISLEKLGGAFFLSIVIPFFLSSFLRIRQMEHWQYLILLPLEAAFLCPVCRHGLWKAQAGPGALPQKRRWRGPWAALPARWFVPWCTAPCSSSASRCR